MQAGSLTVGTTPVRVPVVGRPSVGMRLLCRAANSDDAFLGTADTVTTSTGVLLPKGAPGTTLPYFVPPRHFADGGDVYLVGGGAGQVVDWSAQ